MHSRYFNAAFLILVVAIGCGGNGKDHPKVYPASGKVLMTNNQPMSGGFIQFKPIADSTVTITGQIQADGTFSLSTLIGDEKLPGALPGEHRVTVIPMAQQSDAVVQDVALPIVLQKTFEVKAEGENVFTIELPKSGR